MSVRRSSRANKGRNRAVEQEERELEEALRRAEEEAEAERLKEEEGHVLCSVCGTTDANYEEDDEEQGDFIQCDECRTWQHSLCVLKDPTVVPETYRCNVCDPDNSHYKTLKCKLDPAMVRKVLSEDNKKKAKKQSDFLVALKDLEGEEDFNRKDAERDEATSSDNMSDDDDDEQEEDDDDNAQAHDLGERKPRKRSSSTAEDIEVKKEQRTKKKKKKMMITTQKTTNTPPLPSLDHIEEKAREAVRKRFEGMFLKLLPGHKIPNEEGSIEEISLRWALKLEEDLFGDHHDKQTGKLTRDYKEASTRIFVNVRDVKNVKLRNSIINRHIPFNKLVKMSVNELLNPDLRKEKEEAIKESMSLATLEQVKVSNIRRTHKGDIVLDNEESGNASGQQFDFNVGVHLDDNEMKFTQSEANVERRSVDPVIPQNAGGMIADMYDPGHMDHSDDDNDNDDDDDDNDGKYDAMDSNGELFQDDEDDDLSKILGQTSKKLAESDGYDPNSVQVGSQLWHGQTIFTGITNFDSCVKFISTTLRSDEFRDVSYNVFDASLPLEIEGRLDSGQAENYLLKVASSRKMILLELKKSEDELGTGFKRLWDYFHTKNKFGVVRSAQGFVKDAYIFPLSSRLPRFLKEFPGFKLDGVKERLFIVLVVKQELIKDFAQKTREPLMEYDAKAVLGPNEMALMQKIFEEKPETKNNPVLLVKHLQDLLKGHM